MKSKYGALGAIILCFVLGFLPIPSFLKVIGIILISFVIIYVNRSLFYFIMGNRNYMSKKTENKEKTWQYYRKAYNANLIDKYKITMASILIQKDDFTFGGKILDSIIDKSKDKDLVKRAKIQKSMVYQLNNEIDNAIKILEDVKAEGYNDKNLMINLGTYVLYKGDLNKASRLIHEAKEEEKTSSGIADNHGWYLILKEKWEEAYKIYLDVLERKPRFPDPYVHAAQVFLHYNNVEKAIECLTEASKKTWTNTIFFKQELITQMINNLNSDKSSYYVACINNSICEVAKGEIYKTLSDEEAEKYLEKPFKKEPIVETIEEEEKDNQEIIEAEVDEALPNTELTEEDLKWEEEHK